MSHHVRNLCDACHEREGTCHVTEVSDGVTQTRHLCSECFARLEPNDLRHLAAAAHDAKCQYCDAPANIGGSDPFAVIFGAHRIRRLCFACSSEYSRYTQDSLTRIPTGLSREAQLEEIRQLSDDVGRHMEQWAAQRARGTNA
jgi:protein-arginine kinase activator protein McsA